jgi:hypothetical protein
VLLVTKVTFIPGITACWCKRPWRYVQAEGVELKDVVNLAFHEVFERRQYLPVEE